MDEGEIRRYLEEHIALAPGTKIQYGHPSPRFWSQREPDLGRLLAARRPERPLSLYVHVPFCPPTDPPACGFCLFSREDYTSQKLLAQYVEHACREIDAVGKQIGGVALESLYFGGGTPNLLKPREIERLFDAIRGHFEITPRTEVTFEGYPGLFTRDRLEALAELGTTRISIGVQQLDPQLLRHSGRSQRPEQIEATIRFCLERGLRCSVDLITGWFEQTAEHVVADVDQLADWGATGIVNHPLTLAGDSPFGRRAHELPSYAEMCHAFLAARERMLARGYRADGYTDYALHAYPVVRYLEIYRRILDHDRVGVGYGANSLLAGTPEEPGHTFVNVADMHEYGARTSSGVAPVASGFSFTAEDLRLLFVLKGLEGHPYLEPDEYERRFGSDLRADWEPWWDALEGMGWLTWEEDGPRLAGDGVFYTATVQRCLSEPRNRSLRAEPALAG